MEHKTATPDMADAIHNVLHTAILDASLPAVFFYERRGYQTVGHGIYELENEIKLVYKIMRKKILPKILS